MSRHFHALHYSPWSEKARWAIDHHRLQYVYHEHLPLLGEFALRRRARGAAAASVPLLVEDGQVIGDSWRIVEHAEQIGHGAPLLGGLREQGEAWNRQCERALAAHRALVIWRLRTNRAALEESVAPLAPGSLAKLMRPIGRLGGWYLANKYGSRVDALAEHEATLRDVLDALRGALKSGTGHVAGARFSAADICAALVLQGVVPVRSHVLRLKPATRETWTSNALAEDYPDLLAWRDGIYERHRPLPLAGPGSGR